MKYSLFYICIAYLLGMNTSIVAQESALLIDDLSSDYLTRNPIYDYSEININNTDTIPDYSTKTDKLKLTGTIYLSDGITPAKDVILYISQTDENGDYELRTTNNKRHLQHRGWIKTNADGKYTFYTFVPGSVRRFNEMKHIHAVIKVDGMPEQELDAFLFDDDPLLTKHCRKRLAKNNINSILKPIKNGNLLVANRDIVLNVNLVASN